MEITVLCSISRIVKITPLILVFKCELEWNMNQVMLSALFSMSTVFRSHVLLCLQIVFALGYHEHSVRSPGKRWIAFAGTCNFCEK